MIDAHRLRLLEAMGIDVYALRAPPAGASAATASTAVAPMPAAAARLVVACAHGVRGEARLACLFAQIPRALGVDAQALIWIEADARGDLPEPPDAAAYLALGATAARALGAHLPAARQAASVIAVSEEPAHLPGGGAGKRALWQVVKPVARALRGGSPRREPDDA